MDPIDHLGFCAHYCYRHCSRFCLSQIRFKQAVPINILGKSDEDYIDLSPKPESIMSPKDLPVSRTQIVPKVVQNSPNQPE